MLTKELVTEGFVRDVITLIQNPETLEGTVFDFADLGWFPFTQIAFRIVPPEMCLDVFGEKWICEQILTTLEAEVKRQYKVNVEYNRQAKPSAKIKNNQRYLSGLYEEALIRAIEKQKEEEEMGVSKECDKDGLSFAVKVSGKNRVVECSGDGISPEDIAESLSHEGARTFLDIYNAISQCPDNVKRNEKFAELLDQIDERCPFSVGWRTSNINKVVIEDCPQTIIEEISNICLTRKWRKRGKPTDYENARIVTSSRCVERDEHKYAVFNCILKIAPDGKVMFPFDKQEDTERTE